MKLRTDLQPTAGVKINTRQLNRHNIHPAFIKNINSANMMRSGWREIRGFQLVAGCQVNQSTNTHQHTPMKAWTVCSIQNKGSPISTPDKSDQTHSHTFTSLCCIF